MDAHDENLLLRKQLRDLQLKLHDEEKKLASEEKQVEKLKTPEDLIKEMRLYGDPSNNQFAHQDKILWHPKYKPNGQMELLPEDAILGTIKDSKTLILLQNDNQLLNRFYDMGTRSPGIMLLFDSLYYSWWQGMRLTGALGGQERWLQSFETPMMAGGGEMMTYWEKRKMKKQAKNMKLRDRLLGAVNSGGEEGQIYE